MLFRPLVGNGVARLKGCLDTLTDNVTVVAYVRRPSDLYLSAIQQELRGSGILRLPQPMPYREVLESYRAVFGDRLQIAAYDRDAFPNRDIVGDFTSHFVPEIGDRVAVASGTNINVSSSAEIMALMQDFNLATQSAKGPVVDKRPSAIESLLRVLASKYQLESGRASLRPDIKSYVDSVSTDMLWLRDEFGVRVRGLDYEAIGKATPLELSEPVRVCDLCPVDKTIQDRLSMHLIGLLLRQRDRARAACPQPDRRADAALRQNASTGIPGQ